MWSGFYQFLRDARRLVVLTGAGCSTESGIPDYRSPGGAWTRHTPVYYSAFVRSEDVRRVYWARSFRGWPRFAAARPNAAHRALAELEADGRVHFLITQNVDDLHAEALLVVGSSLAVWSGFRFVQRAAERGIPIAIVNVGPTRGDALATLKIEAACGATLSAALDAVRSARSPA